MITKYKKVIDFLFKRKQERVYGVNFYYEFQVLELFLQIGYRLCGGDKRDSCVEIDKAFPRGWTSPHFPEKNEPKFSRFFYIRPRVTQMKSNFHKKMINMRNVMIFVIEDS